MPVLTANHALAVAAGALALTLYERGVPQAVIAALKGGDVPFNLTGNPPQAGAGIPTGNAVTPAQTGTGGIDFTAAGNAVIAQGAPGGGGDWLNWCLNWVNRTAASLGLSRAAFSAPTADAACGQLDLHPGIAPRGSVVCFRGNHIGIANGNNTYTSAGLIHGGLTVRDYLSNADYIGYSAL